MVPKIASIAFMKDVVGKLKRGEYLYRMPDMIAPDYYKEMPIFTMDEGDPTRNLDNVDEENGVKMDYSIKMIGKLNEALGRVKSLNFKGN